MISTNLQHSSSNRVGYKVHFDRLRSVYYKTSAIRTHKFKCAVSENKDTVKSLQKKFTEVSNVVDSSEKGSILWFLIELYSLGFLFVSSGAKKLELLNELDPENPPLELQNLRSKIPANWREKIKDFAALYIFLHTTPREVYAKVIKNEKLPTGVLENLGKIFEKNLKITNANVENFPEIFEINKKLITFITDKKDFKEPHVREFFQKILFQIDEPLIEVF
ncbi:TPA: hypothetical protein EYG84_02600, partial [Candidatus Gracilibacteria bacterium]|nr:hypothetical protein [Candidatus Gracilibacteria bacterium]